MIDLPRLKRFDWLLFAVAVGGAGAVVCNIPGDPTLESAVTRLTVQEMAASGNWLVPTLDGIPWVDAPPLTHWLIAGVGGMPGSFGIGGAMVIASLLAVLLTVLLTARQGALLLGRRGGLLAGFVATTMLAVAAGFWEAPMSIWLAPAGAILFSLFDRQEAVRRCRSVASFASAELDFAFSKRGLGIAGLFVVLGLLSLLAGPVAVVVAMVTPLIVFVVLQRTRQQARRYLWGWGWLMTASITIAWPLLVWSRIPDVAGIWTRQLQAASIANVDLAGAAGSIVWLAMPWCLLIPIGLWSMYHDAFGRRNSRELLIWCQAVVVPFAVLLLQPGHPEFCLVALTAWAMSAAAGLSVLAERAARLRWLDRVPRLATGLQSVAVIGAAIACVFLLPTGHPINQGTDCELQVVSVGESTEPTRCLATLPATAESNALVLRVSAKGGEVTLVWTRTGIDPRSTERIAVSEARQQF